MRQKELQPVPSAKKVIIRALVANTIKFTVVAMVGRVLLHAAERRAAAA